jgi:hypothetical protein
MNLFQPKINILVDGKKYSIDLDISKKSKYIDNIINKPNYLEIKKDNTDIELKPIFFHDKSINIILTYLKCNKFVFDSDNFDLFIDIVLCSQYLQINTLILDIRNFFIDNLNDIHKIFSLNTNYYGEYNNINNLECSIMDSDIIQINKLVKDIRQRRLMKPVHDDSIRKCCQCSITFTSFIRKHHCRACGRIFCYKCSSKQIEIPEEYLYLTGS